MRQRITLSRAFLTSQRGNHLRLLIEHMYEYATTV